MSNDVMRINIPDIAAPKGHYSHASQFGNLIFISGLLPDFGGATDVSFEEQARNVLKSMLLILRGAGGTPEDLLKVTVYVVGVDHWKEFNAIYADMLGDVRPSRAVVPVPELHYGYKVEVEAIAAKRNI